VFLVLIQKLHSPLGLIALIFYGRLFLKKWETTANRFIGYFDIMGFKEYVFRNSHDRILSQMVKIKHTLDDIYEFEQEKFINDFLPTYRQPSPAFDHSMILYAFFSDSIILVTIDDSYDSADQLLRASSYFLAKCLESGIPIKGALSYGTFTSDFDKSIHFGKPLVDAYLLANDLGFYGAVLHDTMEAFLREKKMLNYSNDIILYNAPFKGKGRIRHYVINWLVAYDVLYKDGAENALIIIERLYNLVSGTPRMYVDNTKEFIDSGQLDLI
jgi:hypothetical protein